MKICEIDMNLMSPITWSIAFSCHKSAKLYTKCLKDFAMSSNDKELVRDHAPIFYGAVKHLIKVQVINLEEFLNPDGVGDDVGCEYF
jgi:hypothetical protein